jgi:hypothetical protein
LKTHQHGDAANLSGNIRRRKLTFTKWNAIRFSYFMWLPGSDTFPEL